MNEATKRAKRLVKWRENERERAGEQVALSRNKCNRATAELEQAQKEVETEQDAMIGCREKHFDAPKMQLALGCLDVAEKEMAEKNKALIAAQTELDEKTKRLLLVHRQVKQMEILHELLKERHEQEVRVKERRELDDLVAIREGSRSR